MEVNDMSWMEINFEDIHEIEWHKIKRFQLCEIFKKGEGKVAQVYPYTVLSSETDDIFEYDRRCDGKRYFCTGFHDNGFTPKELIGTCRGWSKSYFDEIIEAIRECRKDFVRD